MEKKFSPYNDFISRGAECSGGGGDAIGARVCVCAQISFHLFALMRSEVRSVTR